MKDLYHNVKVTQVLDPVVLTTSGESAEIDMQGFESLSVAVSVGESGDTLSGSVKWDVKLQHSDASGSGYEDVTAAELHNASATATIDDAAEDDALIHFGYAGGKRYVKAVITATGSHSSGTPIATVALQGNASLNPVT